MTMKGWAVAVLCLAVSELHGATARKAVALPVPGGRVVLSQRSAQTVVHWNSHGIARTAVLPADDGIYPGTLSDAEVLGTIGGNVLVMSVTYDSRPNGGAHQCGAGTETILRVVSFSGSPRQTFEQLVDSCWLTIEEGDVAWDPSAHTLSVERTTYSDGEAHTNRIYQVDDKGAVRLIVDAPEEPSSK